MIILTLTDDEAGWLNANLFITKREMKSETEQDGLSRPGIYTANAIHRNLLGMLREQKVRRAEGDTNA